MTSSLGLKQSKLNRQIFFANFMKDKVSKYNLTLTTRFRVIMALTAKIIYIDFTNQYLIKNVWSLRRYSLSNNYTFNFKKSYNSTQTLKFYLKYMPFYKTKMLQTKYLTQKWQPTLNFSYLKLTVSWFHDIIFVSIYFVYIGSFYLFIYIFFTFQQLGLGLVFRQLPV